MATADRSMLYLSWNFNGIRDQTTTKGFNSPFAKQIFSVTKISQYKLRLRRNFFQLTLSANSKNKILGKPINQTQI